ncbi:MAG: sugar phosphate isomerase/epimerase, partial [Clostridia bacterium]|nr:sugar phosphate isomerase/epimerase [Clostridia bacterium]
MALPVALQLYSVRDDMEKDFEGTLKKVSNLGYAGVEFAGLFGHTAAQVKALCEKYNLTPISAHVPLVDILADMSGTLAVYKEIGVKFI